MVNDAFDRGWKVWVDGHREELLMADPNARAVHVAGGRHRVSMRFKPLSVEAGFIITFVTAITVGALTIATTSGRGPS